MLTEISCQATPQTFNSLFMMAVCNPDFTTASKRMSSKSVHISDTTSLSICQPFRGVFWRLFPRFVSTRSQMTQVCLVHFISHNFQNLDLHQACSMFESHAWTVPTTFFSGSVRVDVHATLVAEQVENHTCARDDVMSPDDDECK